jgi:hypothetical protein
MIHPSWRSNRKARELQQLQREEATAHLDPPVGGEWHSEDLEFSEDGERAKGV